MMAKIVCDIQSAECMLHRFPNCPRREAVTQAIQDVPQNDMDPDDLISFKQWVHTDRALHWSPGGRKLKILMKNYLML